MDTVHIQFAHVVYALATYPAGILSDRVDRHSILIVGFGLLVVADLVRLRCYPVGIAHGLTQGLLATLVADTAPAELRGTVYGMFNLMPALRFWPRRKSGSQVMPLMVQEK